MARTKKRAVKKFDPNSVLEDVVSSNVKRLGWHDNVMYVQYKNNDEIYFFAGFTRELYGRIRKAESIGKAIHATGVKGQRYVA